MFAVCVLAQFDEFASLLRKQIREGSSAWDEFIVHSRGGLFGGFFAFSFGGTPPKSAAAPKLTDEEKREAELKRCKEESKKSFQKKLEREKKAEANHVERAFRPLLATRVGDSSFSPTPPTSLFTDSAYEYHPYNDRPTSPQSGRSSSPRSGSPLGRRKGEIERAIVLRSGAGSPTVLGFPFSSPPSSPNSTSPLPRRLPSPTAALLSSTPGSPNASRPSASRSTSPQFSSPAESSKPLAHGTPPSSSSPPAHRPPLSKAGGKPSTSPAASSRAGSFKKASPAASRSGSFKKASPAASRSGSSHGGGSPPRTRPSAICPPADPPGGSPLGFRGPPPLVQARGNFVCDECGEVFATASNFAMHKQVHGFSVARPRARRPTKEVIGKYLWPFAGAPSASDAVKLNEPVAV